MAQLDTKQIKYTTAHIATKRTRWALLIKIVLVLGLIYGIVVYPKELGYYFGYWLDLLVDGFNSSFGK